jgi:DNA-binding NarL/FixJ family response regulator
VEEAAARIRVLVVDDHQLFADVLAMLLASDDRFEVVGTAGSGAEAIEAAQARAADVVVMDVFMPVMDGLQATERLLALAPRTRVIAVSGLGPEEVADRARAAGAAAYLQKGAIHEGIAEAIIAAAAGP